MVLGLEHTKRFRLRPVMLHLVGFTVYHSIDDVDNKGCRITIIWESGRLLYDQDVSSLAGIDLCLRCAYGTHCVSAVA